MMTILDEIQGLPEGCAPEELRPFFDRALGGLGKDEAFVALQDLADRQWNSFTKLDLGISTKLDKWLLDNWDRNSFVDAERLTSIVGHLGLVTVFKEMQSEFSALPERVQNEFQAFFEEVGDSVEDPYADMN